MDDAWQYISNFESYELVKDKVQKQHKLKNPISTSQAREISSSFIHSRTYAQAAQDANLTIKPLLLYYSFSSAARGLTLYLSGKRESSLYGSHGLSLDRLDIRQHDGYCDFSACKVHVNPKGLFFAFQNATKAISHLKNNSTKPIEFQSRKISTDSSFTFLDLLSRWPDISEKYFFWKGECNYLSISSVTKQSNNQLKIAVSAPVSDETDFNRFNSFFSGTDFSFVGTEGRTVTYMGSDDVNNLPIFLDIENKNLLGIGDLCLLPLLPSDQGLSKPCFLFSVSFILGMIVRYYPTQWTALINGQQKDGLLPSIKAAIDRLEIEIPRLCASFLRQE